MTDEVNLSSTLAEGPDRFLSSRRLKRCGRSVLANRSRLTNGAYGLFAALLVLLAFLPTGVSATSQTISTYALSPEGSLLRLAFSCLAVGSGIAGYDFWRTISGLWGRLIAGLIAVWVIGDVIDTVVSVDATGGHTLHGTVHAVVAVVAFTAVAGTVLAFVCWLSRHVSKGRLVGACASFVALTSVVVELSVTATSATFMAGTAERLFFSASLVWMIAARRTVAQWSIRAVRTAADLR